MSGHLSEQVTGAWAMPLRARKFHFFKDGQRRCLCEAYTKWDVEPSEFGTGQPDESRCPTCERKLGYFLEALRV